METVVLVTGGFDPLHSGHLAYFKAARELGDKLIVGINSKTSDIDKLVILNVIKVIKKTIPKNCENDFK